MLTLIAIAIFLIIIGSTWWFGLWNNLLTLINLLLAGLVASSFYENMAITLEAWAPSFIYFSDFLAVWLIFVLVFAVLRTATDLLSSMRLRFDPVTEMMGRSVLSIWIAVVFIAFSFFTLHMAPIPPDFYGDLAAKPARRMIGVGPDRFWLAFIQSRSRGALAESRTAPLLPAYDAADSHPEDAELDARVFDPKARFIDDFHANRQKLSQQSTLRTASN